MQCPVKLVYSISQILNKYMTLFYAFPTVRTHILITHANICTYICRERKVLLSNKHPLVHYF